MTPGEALRSAQSARRMTVVALAGRVGMSETQLLRIRRHGSVPMLASAEALAEALDAPEILTATLDARTKRCETCGGSFVDGTRNLNGRYCLPECQSTGFRRRRKALSREHLRGRAEVAENRLGLYQGAVDRFCRECGGATCPMASCPLRRVSPLPLAGGRYGKRQEGVA